MGVQKSGNTWVADVLSQHPDVLVRKKEISFFVRGPTRPTGGRFADMTGRALSHWLEGA